MIDAVAEVLPTQAVGHCKRRRHPPRVSEVRSEVWTPVILLRERRALDLVAAAHIVVVPAAGSYRAAGLLQICWTYTRNAGSCRLNSKLGDAQVERRSVRVIDVAAREGKVSVWELRAVDRILHALIVRAKTHGMLSTIERDVFVILRLRANFIQRDVVVLAQFGQTGNLDLGQTAVRRRVGNPRHAVVLVQAALVAVRLHAVHVDAVVANTKLIHQPWREDMRLSDGRAEDSIRFCAHCRGCAAIGQRGTRRRDAARDVAVAHTLEQLILARYVLVEARIEGVARRAQHRSTHIVVAEVRSVRVRQRKKRCQSYRYRGQPAGGNDVHAGRTGSQPRRGSVTGEWVAHVSRLGG